MGYLDGDGLARLWSNIKAAFVPQTRKINNKPLSADITLTSSDLDGIELDEHSIDGMKFDGTADIHHYGTCTTAASTAAKVGTTSTGKLKLAEGAVVCLKFTYTNTASSATLNVDSTGAYPIYKYGTTRVGTSTAMSWFAGETVGFVFDGSAWRMLGSGYRSDSTLAVSSAVRDYGYCTASASASAKSVAYTGYVLRTNATFLVLFPSANSYAGALTMNVNSTGGKSLYINGSASSSSNYTIPAGIYWVYYSGSAYYLYTDGIVRALAFSGNGQNLTALNASNLSSGTVSADLLPNSGATADDYGPTSDASLTMGTSFTVPALTVDAKGRITSVTDRTLTLPGATSSSSYGMAYCDTAGSTAAKTAKCDGFVLRTYGWILLTLVNANSYSGALTLNVNSTGAKSIYINGVASSSSNRTLPAGTYMVYYTGAVWDFRTQSGGYIYNLDQGSAGYNSLNLRMYRAGTSLFANSYLNLQPQIVHERVWENPDPDSSFDAQIVSFTPEYVGAMYMIEFRGAPFGNANNRASNKTTQIVRAFSEGILTYAGGANYWRCFCAGYGKIFFNDGLSGTSSQDDACVPIAIYELGAMFPGEYELDEHPDYGATYNAVFVNGAAGSLSTGIATHSSSVVSSGTNLTNWAMIKGSGASTASVNYIEDSGIISVYAPSASNSYVYAYFKTSITIPNKKYFKAIVGMSGYQCGCVALVTSVPSTASKVIPNNNIGYAQPFTESNKLITREVRIDVSSYQGTSVYLLLSCAGSSNGYAGGIRLLEAWFSDEA